MSSETITRNDLTAILNEVLPNPSDMTPQEVEDFVDGLNIKKNVEFNDFAQWTDISSYTSANPFTAPCDGYVFVYNTSSQTGFVGVIGSVNEYGGVGVGASNGRTSTFVRKGMRMYASGSSSAQRFMPIVEKEQL